MCGDGDDDVAKDESPEDEDDVRVNSAADDDESAGFVEAKTAAAAAKSDVDAESVRLNERCWPEFESSEARLGAEVDVGSAAGAGDAWRWVEVTAMLSDNEGGTESLK